MLSLIIIFLRMKAFAQIEGYHLNCTTPDQQISVEIFSNKDKMIFTYKNKMGKNFFPFYSGPVNANSFNYLRNARNNLRQINQKLEMSWPLEQCSIDNNQSFLIECNGKGIITFPLSSTLYGLDLSTSIINENTFNFSYEHLQFRFNIVAHNEKYEISIPFTKDRCQQIRE